MVVATRLLIPLVLAATLPLTAQASGFRRYGGEAIVAVVEVPRTADPVFSSTAMERMLTELVHAGLFTVGSDGNVLPLLADHTFAAPADGRAYRIRIRAGAQFGDGSEITADDVVASLARLAVSDAGWLLSAVEGADIFGRGDAREISGIQILGKRQLLIRTTTPFYGLDSLLAAPEAAVTRRGRDVDAFWGPPGAGPFTPASAESNTWSLTPSAHYVQGRPFVDRLVFKRAADDLTASRWVNRGRAHAAFTYEDPRKIEPSTTVLLLNDNIAKAERARATGSIDRTLLTEVFLRGRARSATTLLPPPLGRPIDSKKPERSKRGDTVRRTLWLPDSPAELTAVAERIAVDLLGAGILVERRTATPQEIARRAARGEYDFLLLEWRPAALDPALAMWEWGVRPSLKNAAGSTAARAAALPAMRDATARWEAAQKTEAALLATHRVLPLYHPTRQCRSASTLKGMSTGARGLPEWADAWLQP